MTKFPLISVIIVSWNVADSIKLNLNSVFTAKYPNLEVLVTDNASSDNSVSVIKSFPSVKLFKNFRNLGYSKAVKNTLSQASGEYLVMLNPDARIPRNFFTHMLEFAAAHCDMGVVGPKLIHPDGSSQGSVFPEPSIINYIREFWFGQTGLTEKYTPDVSSPIAVNAVQGACMFIPRRIYQKIGPMSDSTFMYYEDLDYCRRIRRAGLQVYFDPTISVVHEHGSSAVQNPAVARYLQDSSLWYNGWFKYHLLNFIIRTGRFFRGKN